MIIERVTSDGVFDYIDIRMPVGTKAQFRRAKGSTVVTRYAGRDRLTRTSIWKYVPSAETRQRVATLLDEQMRGVSPTFGLCSQGLY